MEKAESVQEILQVNQGGSMGNLLVRIGLLVAQEVLHLRTPRTSCGRQIFLASYSYCK